MEKRLIWVDCDVGADDAVALLTARQMPELEVLGVSATAGNAPQNCTFPNARKILRLAGAPWPVYPGAEGPLARALTTAAAFHGPDGLWGVKLPLPDLPAETIPAWDAIYAAALHHPGAMDLIATGPLTNVALALQRHPELRELLPRILFMGGSTAGGNTTSYAEYNFYVDPEAAAQVLASGIPLVMCGLDVTMQAYLTPRELRDIFDLGGPVSQTLEAILTPSLERAAAQGQPGRAIHDLCPIVYAVHPELFREKPGTVTVETAVEAQRGRVRAELSGGPVHVVLWIDRPAFAGTVRRAMEAYAAEAAAQPRRSE